MPSCSLRDYIGFCLGLAAILFWVVAQVRACWCSCCSSAQLDMTETVQHALALLASVSVWEPLTTVTPGLPCNSRFPST